MINAVTGSTHHVLVGSQCVWDSGYVVHAVILLMKLLGQVMAAWTCALDIEPQALAQRYVGSAGHDRWRPYPRLRPLLS